MELKQLLAARGAEVIVSWEDEKVVVTYNPNAWTPDVEAMALETQGSGGVADMLAGILTGWDITSQGEPFPPTAENLRTLPLLFLGEVLKTLAKEMAPDPLSVKTSDATS